MTREVREVSNQQQQQQEQDQQPHQRLLQHITEAATASAASASALASAAATLPGSAPLWRRKQRSLEDGDSEDLMKLIGSIKSKKRITTLGDEVVQQKQTLRNTLPE